LYLVELGRLFVELKVDTGIISLPETLIGRRKIVNAKIDAIIVQRINPPNGFLKVEPGQGTFPNFVSIMVDKPIGT
jgi:hypothetical protein